MQAIVDAGFAFRLRPPDIERVTHAGSLCLNGEVDDGGGASDSRGSRAGEKVVGRDGAAEWHVHVGVRVDASRDHKKTRGVHNRVSCGIDVSEHLTYRAAFD